MNILLDDVQGETLLGIVTHNGLQYILFESGNFVLYEYGVYPDGQMYFQPSDLDSPPKFLQELMDQQIGWQEV